MSDTQNLADPAGEPGKPDSLLKQLLTHPTINPDIYHHGEWVNRIRNNQIYHFSSPQPDLLAQFISSLTTSKPVYAPVFLQYETSILTENDTVWVENETGEHMFVKFTRTIGVLEMLPASIKVLHDQTPSGEYQVADDYWTVNTTTQFHPGVKMGEIVEGHKPHPRKSTLLTVNSVNQKLTITPTPQN